MSVKATLLMVLHNHQPVGNFDHVFEECTERCYHPVLEALAEFPEVRLTLHTTGPLLEWLLEHRPDTIDLMRSLAKRGQIEILGGTHNEAMAAVLPDRDVRGQIAMMRRWCTENLDYTPRGMWLAERVWDPDLPRVLHEAGVEYTLLDDIGFRYAGVDESTVWGHFVTEKAGHPLTLFPIDQHLRYTIPFEKPEATLDHLRAVSDEVGGHIWLTYGDDGEKFGIWPDTYDRIWGDRQWLREFFQALTDAKDEIATATLSDAVDNYRSRGRVYLPTCSYQEMMEWAQPPASIAKYEALIKSMKANDTFEANQGFVRGGIWQAFLSKYPESDRMHKRMISVSERVHRLRLQSAEVDWLEDAHNTLSRAQHHLYRAQCNDAYWHGLFGGLYLTNLRYAVWTELLAADVLLDVLDPPDGTPEWVDLDLDGNVECILANEQIQLVIDPHDGGSLTELSFKPCRFNLADTLCRRHEHYHDLLLNPPPPEPDAAAAGQEETDEDRIASPHDVLYSKEEGLEKLLVYDQEPLALLRDRFLDPEATIEIWGADARTSEVDIGDFATGEYAVGLTEDGIELARVGQVAGREVRVLKRLTLEDARITCSIILELANGDALPVRYAPELSFNLLAPEADDRSYHFDDVRPEVAHMISVGSVVARKASLTDGFIGLRADCLVDWDAEWWRAPVQTVSLSEAGVERIYQASVLLPQWQGVLEAGKPQTLELVIELSKLAEQPGS